MRRGWRDDLLGHPRLVSPLAVVLLVLIGSVGWSVFSPSPRAVPGRTGPSATPIPAAPAPGPADGVVLSGWKLTVPVENEKGSATTIEPAVPSAPWLTPSPGGGLTFWAPTTGATTKHSEHPRTELDSLTNFTAGRGVHTLAASVTLVQGPRDGRGIILGQIHGAAGISSVPYVMLRYQDGVVRVVVKQLQHGKTLINYPLLDHVGLNTRFNFSLTDRGDGSMAFTTTLDGRSRQVVAPVPAQFQGATVRFQAGDYQQANDSAGAQDGGRVIFHKLRKDSAS
jgi:hypothetical protein